MGQVELTFLGVLTVHVDGQLMNLRTGRMQNLLAYLVLEAAHPHTRSQLAALLWPDEPETVAKQNLRQTLYELRRLVEPATGSTPPFFLVTRETVQFNRASAYRLDVDRFHNHLAQHAWGAAIDCYQGDLLAGAASASELFAEWLLVKREQCHLQAVDALDHLIEQARTDSDYAQVQQYARRQLHLDPWREVTHRHLLHALAATGEAQAALTHYESWRQALATELGISPAAETVALVEEIRTEIGRQETGDRRYEIRDTRPVSQSPNLLSATGARRRIL